MSFCADVVGLTRQARTFGLQSITIEDRYKIRIKNTEAVAAKIRGNHIDGNDGLVLLTRFKERIIEQAQKGTPGLHFFGEKDELSRMKWDTVITKLKELKFTVEEPVLKGPAAHISYAIVNWNI